MKTLTKNEIRKAAIERGETSHYSGKLRRFFFCQFSDPIRIDNQFNQARHKSYISEQQLTPRQKLVRKRKGKS